MKIAIVTPTYNEAGNIERLITEVAAVCKEIKDSTFTLLVADDNSPDGTAQLAESVGKKVKSKTFVVRTLVRKKKDGIGNAYINAFNVLLKENFDYIIQIDADLSHNPKYLKDFVELARQGKDFVAASRYMKGGGITNWTLHRRMLSLGGNIYTRAFLGSTITDYTNGLNMFSTKLLKQLDTDGIASGGYGFFIELKYRAIHQAKNFAQVPMMLVDRENGESKIPKNTIFINLVLVPRLRFGKTK
jgi:dolichol-phosphate mannosyltransferase